MNPRFSKILRDPLGAVRRTIDKFVLGPRRYRNTKGYDANAYWGHRFSRHGDSLRGPGDEGLSESSNDREYSIAGDIFREFCSRNRIDFASETTLEIGPGTGYYTGIMVELAARALTCMDVTDVLFADLQRKFPAVEFRLGDVTQDKIDGSFQRAVVIDVIEHIVTEDAFDAALRNVASAVVDDGCIVLGPVDHRHGRHLFYVHFWNDADVRRALPDWKVIDDVPFRSGKLVLLGREAGPTGS